MDTAPIGVRSQREITALQGPGRLASGIRFASSHVMDYTGIRSSRRGYFVQPFINLRLVLLYYVVQLLVKVQHNKKGTVFSWQLLGNSFRRT